MSASPDSYMFADELDRDAMIRVNQAGEYGAKRIYAGQMAIMGNRAPASTIVAGMAEQEERHLAFFDRLIAERGVRPTLMQPLWGAAGYALGAVTALMGPEAAMACTAAVETEIDKHYAEQLDDLGDSDPELSGAITQFQAEELEHKQQAIDHGAEQAFGYPIMSAVIRLGCRAAISLAKRI